MAVPTRRAVGKVVLDRENRWHQYLREIAKGDGQALGNLYDESGAALFGLALRMLKNEADAEEVLLEVFEQLWRSAQNFNPSRGSVWCWLTVLTRSRAVDRLRSTTAKRGYERISMTDGWDVRCSEPLPDQASMLREQQSLIKRALSVLPDEQRQALELAYFSELTHVEIAAELGVPLGTIKTRIRTAMEKLRVALATNAQAATESTL